MDDQLNSPDNMMTESRHLHARLESSGQKQEADSRGAETEFSHSQSFLYSKPDLNSFAMKLANQPNDQLFSFMNRQLAGLFSLKAALITIFNDDPSELEVVSSFIPESDSSVEVQNNENNFFKLRIPLNQNEVDHISSSPYYLICDLKAGIPYKFLQAYLRVSELIPDSDWFLEVGFIYRQKLAGALLMFGSKRQGPPSTDEIHFLCGITANAFVRKMAEDILAEKEIRIREMFDKSPSCYQMLDKKGCFIEVNQAWLDTFGYSYVEVIGEWIGGFLTEKSRSNLNEDFSHLNKSGKFHWELEMIHKSGNTMNIDWEGETWVQSGNKTGQAFFILKDITAQRKAENLAIKQEEMVEAIANYTANWESWFDNNGKIIWTNPASVKFTGYSPAEILALPDYVESLVAETDRERVSAIFSEALLGIDDSSVEFQCVRKDNSLFRMLVTWKHIYNKVGISLGIRTSGQDITNFRKAEEDFSQTESLYRQMIDNAPFGMHFYHLNDKGTLIFTSANQAADSILGIDHLQLTGIPIEEAFPSLKGTGVIEHYHNAALNNKTWVTDQIVYSDNKISGAFEVKAFQTAPGRMVAIFSDITNRKQAEEALQESQQLFETLTRVSPVGIFRTNASGATTFVNPKWTALTGLSFQDAMDYKYLSAIHPDDKEERVKEWNTAVKKGKPVVSEYRFLRSDGSVIWVQGHAVPEIADGRLKGYIGTITDISELKRFEQELLQAKDKAGASNRLKTTFMGNISHEIRTPLNGIIGFAELISSGNNTKEENEECIGFLNNSINRLTKIIDNMMDLSMMMSGNTSAKSENFRIDLLLKEVIQQHEMPAIRKNLLFNTENLNYLAGKRIISDQSLIKRIYNELVSNAIKFTNQGSVTVLCHINNNTLTFSVKDSGIGISQHFLPYIFEPFVQEDVYTARVNNSNGLGLSIVNEAVNMLGGKVIAESTPGSGTSITVSLPVIEAPGENDLSGYQPETPKENDQPVILIVEDEEINMIYLRRILNLKDYKLFLANNGMEAINLIEQGNHVDLILMDMKMPGMDGFETTRRIKEIAPGIKIAAVTAYASESDRKECIEAGCDNYLSKPFQKNDLYQLINKML